MSWWLEVVGHEGYEVSSEGEVRRKSTGRILKPDVRWDGGKVVTLCEYGITKKRYVHQLVMAAFYPEFEYGTNVVHRDMDKSNNRLENLMSWKDGVGCLTGEASG